MTQQASDQANTPLIQPKTDLYRTADGHLLLMDLPGVGPEDLSVHVEDTVLTIEAHSAGIDKVGGRLPAAFGPQHYRRTLVLGEQIDRDHIRAELRGGTLTVTLPHASPAQARRIEVHTA